MVEGTKIPEILLSNANNKKNRYKAVVKYGGKKRTVYFGDINYENYLIHKNLERLRLYDLRH
jgi:hypothetical protein